MSDHFVSVDKCKIIHEQSEKQFVELKILLQNINDRLFRDNGHLSIQTRLDRHQRIVNGLCWAMGIIGAAVMVNGVCFAFKVIKHVGMQ